MRNAVLIVLASCFAASLVTAAGKKGKEIPTQICTRGKLIFEDDFSGKDIDWSYDEKLCEWRIVKGKLVGTGKDRAHLRRSLASTQRIIVQVEVTLKENCSFFLHDNSYENTGIRGVVELSTGVLAIDIWTPQETTRVAIQQLPKTNTKSLSVLFEIFDGKTALSALGRAVTHDLGQPARTTNGIGLCFLTNGPIAIDNVMVWEALPKDQADEKENKK